MNVILDSQDDENSSDDEEEEDGEGDDTTDDSDEATDDNGNLSSADSSGSKEDDNNCAICLSKFRNQEVGVPESCNHNFCIDCIVEWSKVSSIEVTLTTAFGCFVSNLSVWSCCTSVMFWCGSTTRQVWA